MFYREMNDNQRRVFIDTVQLYEAFAATLHKNRSYKDGMHWKKAKGREYLFRSHDRYGYGKSLGLRSPETEEILGDFRLAKQQAKNRLVYPCNFVPTFCNSLRYTKHNAHNRS